MKPRRDFQKLEQRRRKGMQMFAKGFSQADVARHCDVSETTSFRWKKAWLRKGPSAWKRGRLGRPPKIDVQPHQDLRADRTRRARSGLVSSGTRRRTRIAVIA
ncbi:MAG: helix-turn-helix domain-containing protein [Verrucomicrobiota bacterium]